MFHAQLNICDGCLVSEGAPEPFKALHKHHRLHQHPGGLTVNDTLLSVPSGQYTLEPNLVEILAA